MNFRNTKKIEVGGYSMRKCVKKIIGLCLALIMVLSIIPNTVADAETVDYTAENLMTNVEYAGKLDDTVMFKFQAPATMKVNFRSKGYTHNITLYDSNWDKIDATSVYGNETVSYYVNEGEIYYFELERFLAGDDQYCFEICYVLDRPTISAKSLKNNKMLILSQNGNKRESIDGYEIRYRTSGKKWKSQKVETINSLKKEISGLSKGKVYTVQIRKYVENYNNKFYYSKWSEKVKVTLK